ncbi:MAG: RNA methyltransferase, partial [Rectinema sp.]|nr:RNA methyltransferase [Rectinema sp.]
RQAQESGQPREWPLHVLPHDELCRLVDFKFHRGALAVADMPALPEFDGYVTRVRDRTGQTGPNQRFFLCLWEVTDPSNLGALIRVAAGLGADGILLGPGCANPFYRKALRACMGTVFSLPVWTLRSEGLARCRETGAFIVGAALTERAVSIDELDTSLNTADRRAGPIILVLGNEGYGLPSAILSQCSCEVCIPMAHRVDSLNVAVAGGILMHTLMRFLHAA